MALLVTLLNFNAIDEIIPYTAIFTHFQKYLRGLMITIYEFAKSLFVLSFK